MSKEESPADLTLIDRKISDFMVRRIAELGEIGSGAYQYYVHRVRSGVGLLGYERELFEALRGEPLVVHCGIGFGTLLVALALTEMRCVGYEVDGPRYEGAVALRAALGADTNYEIKAERYPDNLSAIGSLDDATLVFTNVGAGWDEVAEAKILDTFGLFRRVILELAMFGRRRDTAREREELVQEIVRRGFEVTPLNFKHPGTFFVSAEQRQRPGVAGMRRRTKLGGSSKTVYAPLKEFRARATQIGWTLGDDPATVGLYWRVIDSVDAERVSSLQSKYADDLVDFDPAGIFKYADLPYWIAHKVVYAREIGLDSGPPRTILDIGMGAGHFAAVCQALGHTVVGTDIAVPVYDDICNVLSVDRRIEPTVRRKPMADLGLKFDLVTIIWQVFNIVRFISSREREYWSADDWAFLLRDLVRNHLRYPGSIFLELNRNMSLEGEAYDGSLIQWSRERGAHVEESRGRILFNHIIGPSALRKGRESVPATEFSPAFAFPTAGVAKATSTLAERLNTELLIVHRERLAMLGAAESGLYAHYEAMLERESLVGRRESSVLDLIDVHLPCYDAYAVLRAGLGEMALLLAASGRNVTAYEPDLNRRTAVEAGRARLEDLGLVMPGALRIVAALTPDGPLTGRVLGIGLDVAHVREETATAPFMKHMDVFDALLIDLRTFLRLREHPTDRALAVTSLEGLGFESHKHFFAAGPLSWFQKGSAEGSLAPNEAP